MSEEIKTALDTLGRGFEEFKKANDERLAAVEKKGTADPLLLDKIAKIEADLDTAQKAADEAVLAVKRAGRAETEASDIEQKAAAFSRQIASSLDRRTEPVNAEAVAAYKAAAELYLRKGLDALSNDERKALSVGGDPTGGYVVNPDMSGRIVTKVFETSPMRAYASVQTISTDALEGLYDLNEAGANWEGETQTPSETTTPDLGKWRIPVYELRAKPRATQKILDDAEINIEAWLAGKVGEKFGRTETTAFVVGDGVNKPRGFLSYGNGTTLPGTIEQFKTGVNGGFAAAPNGGDALLDALYGLKADYRINANWFMNRGAQKAVRKLKDSDGNYLWAPGLVSGQPATLLGYGIASFEDMPAIATGSLSIAVGDMRQAYQIVDRIGIRTLRDPFTAKPFVEFYTTKRVGGDVVNFEALKLINFAA